MSADFSSIIDNVLPMAYIENVSLKQGSYVEPRQRSLRRTPTETVLKKTRYGKTEIKAKQSKVSLLRESSKSLVVKVSLAFKDVPSGRTGKGRWFGQDFANEYLKARVMLCTDEKSSNMLAKGSLDLAAIQKMKGRGTLQEEIFSLIDYSGETIVDKRREKIGKNIVYTITHQVSFSVPDYTPNHLSVFAMTFLETFDSAIKNQSVSRDTLPILQSYVTGEILIDDGMTKNNATVFRKKKNSKIWAGPVHYHKKKGYMEGAQHSQRSHGVLKEAKVENTVLEDHRIFDKISKAKLYLRPEGVHEADSRRKKQKNRSASDAKSVSAEKYVSEVFSSKSLGGASSFLFQVDFESFIQRKGRFGNLLNVVDAKAKKKIISMSRIENALVYRDRVTRGLKKGEIKIDPEATRSELIARSSERRGKGKLERALVENVVEGGEEGDDTVVIGAIKEVDVFTGQSKGLRTLQVSDFELARVGTGEHQYTFDANIVDGTVSFVKSQLDELIKAQNRVSKYYNSASTTGRYNYARRTFSGRFKRQMRNNYIIPPQSEIMFNTKKNRRKLVDKSISSAPYVRGIAIYTDVLYNMTTINSRVSLKVARLLSSISSPDTGSPEGIKILLDLMGKLIYDMKKALGGYHTDITERNFSTFGTVLGSAINSSKSINSSLNLKHSFRKIFKAKGFVGVGYDFLEGGKKNVIGIREISVNRFSTRILRETKRHFRITGKQRKTGNSGLDLEINNVSYLSPAGVYLSKDQHISFIKNQATHDIKNYQRAMSRILTLKKLGENSSAISYNSAYKEGSDSELEPKDVGLNIMNMELMSKLGTTIIDPSVYRKEVSPYEKREAGSADAGEAQIVATPEVLGEDNLLSSDEIPVEENVVIDAEKDLHHKADFSAATGRIIADFATSGKNLIRGAKVKTISEFLISNKNNIFEQTLRRRTRLSRKDIYSKLPNQHKSLVMTGPSTTNNWASLRKNKGVDIFEDPKFSAYVYYNYYMINRIEVFIGYRESKETGKGIIGAPVFQLLTPKMIERAQEKGESLLCRMRPHHDSMLGFEHKKRLALPSYDKHFVIKPGKQIKKPSPGDLPKDSYVNRLSERTSLNSTGDDAMRILIQIAMERRSMPPAYITTMPRLEQHLTASKVGTNFTGDMRRKAKSISKTTVVDVLSSLDDGSRKGPFDASKSAIEPTKAATLTSAKMPGKGGRSGGGGSSY